MQAQSLKNHAQIVPGFHYVTLVLLLAVIIGAGINLANAPQVQFLAAALLLVLSIAVMLLAFFARGFALKAQDRAIRVEENFRHFIATGKPFDSSLKMGQIIALRFASDAEFVTLVKKATSEKLSAKEIKQAITTWKADYNRA